jgi:hypothetical protein
VQDHAVIRKRGEGSRTGVERAANQFERVGMASLLMSQQAEQMQRIEVPGFALENRSVLRFRGVKPAGAMQGERLLDRRR